MSAEDLVQLLEKRGILPDRLIAKLRAKIAETDRPMTAEMLAKFLVQKQHLSATQAAELISDLPGADAADTMPSAHRASGSAEEGEDSPGSSSIFASLLPQRSKSSANPSDDADVINLTPLTDDELEDDQRSEREIARSKRPKRSNEPPKPSTKSEVDDDPLADLKPLGAAASSIIKREKAKKKLGKKVESRVNDSLVLAEVEKRGRRKKIAKRKSQWDSPLMLIGGGALALLVLCGGVVALILNWEGGDDQLKLAQASRDAGAYAQAIERYDEFLTKFPRHPERSAARVQLAMLRLRNDTEGGDFERALATAQSELAAIENEDKFTDARAELTALLPRIAKELAAKAESATDPAETERWTKAANDAIVLATNGKYVPKTMRDEGELNEIQETLARVSRRQQTGQNLNETLAAMEAAISKGDTRAAYAAQKQLVSQHPELANDEKLAAMVVKTSLAEQAGVKFVGDEKPADKADRPNPWIATLTLANRRGGGQSPDQGVFCVRVDGAIYALDVSNGQLLWRRFVGFGSDATPLNIANDVLVTDAEHHDLLRLDGRTGRLIWRQNLGEPFAAPVTVGERAFVAAESGKLYVLDLSSGTRLGYLQFAQPLRVAPCVDRRGESIYLTGDHSSLYTVSLGDLTCTGVYYLGHSSGSIRLPQAQVMDKLVVLENDGVATCRLLLLTFAENGAVAQVETERRLNGLAAAPPLIAGRRVILATDRGALNVFEISAGEGDKALTSVATREATASSPLIRHVTLTDGAVWVGDTQLTKYAVLPTGNRLPVQTIDNNYPHSTFDHPFGVFGGTLLHVRRVPGQAGAVVAAMDAARGSSYWETDLAIPPAAAPVVNEADRTFVLADVNGHIFRFDEQAIRARVQDQPLPSQGTPSSAPKLTGEVDLGGGRVAYAAPVSSDYVLLYDPAAGNQPARWVKLPGTLACYPAPFGQGLLVPLEIGQVFFLNTVRGQALAAPFQPRLQPRNRLDYQPPCQVDDTGRQFVITDGHEKIYLVGLVDQPEPQLAPIAEAKVGPFPIVSPPVVFGKTVFAVTGENLLTRFQLPTLAAAGEVDLGGEVNWGPYRVGDRLLIATSNNQLFAIGSDGNILWKTPLGAGDLAGPPLAADQSFLLAYRNGTLERRTLADGQPAGKLSVEHPLAAGPVRYLQRILLTAHDGTLMVVDQP